MQKILLSFVLFFTVVSTAIAASSGSDLDLAITPIRSDITAPIGKSTGGSVTLYNNSKDAHSFIMSAEDCTMSTNNGTPLCSPINSGTITASSLGSWITFDTTGIFSIPAKGKRTIGYTIHTPVGATPGGHYGAIFFNTPSSSQVNSISMNRRLGSLLLVTIPGDIVVAPQFGEISVVGAGGISAPSPSPIQDLFSAPQSGSIMEQIKGKGEKLLMVFSDPVAQEEVVSFINPFWKNPELDANKHFNTSITLPVENKGTIHIQPSGKITLHELDGTALKNIGKELIKNENGAVVGEKIVDYLTINEENGNVLPGTKRIFAMDWEGFAHQSITPDGTIAISYESPGEYYSRIAREQQGYLYPWEKLSLTHTDKEIIANIDLSYKNPVTGEVIQKNSSIPLTIEYEQIVKSWNTGLLSIAGLLLFILTWVVFRGKKKGESPIASEYTTDEIKALERAQAIIFAKKSAKTEKKPVRKPRARKTIAENPESETTPRKTPAKKTTKKPKVAVPKKETL